MIIKSPNDSLFKDRILKSALFLFIESKWKYLLAFVLLTIIVIGSVKYGRDLQKTGQYGNFQLFLGNALKSNTAIPLNYIKGLLSKPDQLDISIKHLDFQKLAYQAQEAEKLGYIASHLKEDYVPATIKFKEKTYKVKLRLKGLELKHLQPEKWSLKIKVKNNTIKGLSEFAIQAPPTRAYLNEWIYHKFLGHENLLHLKTDFVNVSLNGKDIGVFNLEESFNKTVLERNQRREGLIFRIIKGGTKVYGANSIKEKRLKHANHIGLVSQVAYDFMKGKLTTSEVFDVDKTARYFAVSDLFGGIHGHLELNFPMYFNPINHRFEPIGYDANSGMQYVEGSNGIAGSWHGAWTAGDRLLGKRIFSDTAFYKVYVAELEKLNKSYYEKILDSLENDLSTKLSVLYKSYPEYFHSTGYFDHNLKTIQKTLSPAGKIQNPVFLYKKIKHQILVNFNNVSNVPIKILGLAVNGKPIHTDIEGDLIKYPHLKNEENKEFLSFKVFNGLQINDTLMNRVDLRYKVLGAKEEGSVNLALIVGEEIEYPKAYLQGSIENLQKFAFIEVNTKLKEINILEGEHQLHRDLIIPRGYHLVIGNQTSIDLINGSKIISHSPVRLNGLEDKPIKIFSSDTSGQGFTVLQAGGESVLRHVSFENMRNPKINAWSLSGAINFYQSNVTLTGCVFDTNYSEDMLNIIQSRFEMQHCKIKNTYSDAFDGDFVQGSINNSVFENSGNDAIDVSGSKLSVDRVEILHAGDKGLSAGEDSYIAASNMLILKSEIAVASKDKSHIELDGIKIDQSTIGFTCFQKKEEYDIATINAKGVNLVSTKIPYLLEERSGLNVNGKEIPPSRGNVKEILYGVEYGKKTVR